MNMGGMFEMVSETRCLGTNGAAKLTANSSHMIRAAISAHIADARNPKVSRICTTKNGWTALSFWDRSVDERGGCNSTYFAQGIFTFEQMVEMAKSRFAYRWNKMTFEITKAESNFETVV